MKFFRNFFEPSLMPQQPSMPQIHTVLTQTAISNMMRGVFLPIPVKRLSMKPGESCLFCDHAVSITEKLRVVGRQRLGGAFSIRIMKGLTYHTGNGGDATIRENVQEYTQGKLYITNKRIIFSADSKAFQRKISDVVAYSIEESCLIIQFTNKSYRIYLPVAECADKVLEYIL